MELIRQKRSAWDSRKSLFIRINLTLFDFEKYEALLRPLLNQKKNNKKTREESSILNVHHKLTHEINWDSTNLWRSLRFIVSIPSSRIQIIRFDCSHRFYIGQTVTRSVLRDEIDIEFYTECVRLKRRCSLFVAMAFPFHVSHVSKSTRLVYNNRQSFLYINFILPTRCYSQSISFDLIYMRVLLSFGLRVAQSDARHIVQWTFMRDRVLLNGK